MISVPAGKRVKLTFEDFDLGNGSTASQDCTLMDFVEIRDGQLSESKELAKYCSFNKMGSVPDVYSTGNYMRVKFSTSAFRFGIRTGGRGFKARFEASAPCKYCLIIISFC